MRSLSAAALAGAAAATLACGASSARRPAVTSADEMTCITRREINAIRPLDERHALVRLRAGDHYMLTLDAACVGLDAARTLVLDRSESRICGDGTSLVSYELPGVGPTRCRVERIEPVESQAAAMELIEERKGPQ